jgi:NAD/NADP transhydrogenase beta subunit
MSTAALKTPVEQLTVEQARTLSIVEKAQPATGQVSADRHPFAPVIAAFVIAFIGAITFVGSFAAWIYFLRDSGVMAP